MGYKFEKPETTEQLHDNTKLYRELFTQKERGPQHEGVTAEEAESALRDPATHAIELEVSNEIIRFPLFMPYRYNGWLSPDFFDERFDSPVYYVSHIQEMLEDESVSGSIRSAFEELYRQRAVLITEHLEGNDDPAAKIMNMLNENGIPFKYDSLTDNESYPASEWHYGGEITPLDESPISAIGMVQAYDRGVQEGKYEDVEESGSGTRVVDTVEGHDLDRLWDLYRGPFSYLGSIHPIRSSFTYEEFTSAMTDPNVTKVIHQEDGEIVTFCFLQSDLDYCPWINKDFYKNLYPQKYEDGDILYFPGIVTDENKRGHAYAENVINMLVDAAHDSGTQPMVIFECNDLSREYIPKIVERYINDSNKLHIDIQQVGRHVYQAIELSED